MNKNEKIKKIRQDLGLSQTELGNRIGLTGPHISRLERGLTEVSDSVLQKYIDVFNVNRSWLYDDDSNPENSVFLTNSVNNSTSPTDRIKELRLSLGMSQNKFAEYTGVKSPEINCMESGKVVPGPQTLKRIAETCHVGIDWIRFGDENKKNYPVDDNLIAYLWKNEKLRETIYKKMNQENE